MESEDRHRRRGPPAVRREFVRSRHEQDWAAQAYSIVVPVVSRALRVAVCKGASHRDEGAVALRRPA
jgi:hypothetical protein